MCVNAQMLDVAHEYLRENLAKKPTILLVIVVIPIIGKSVLFTPCLSNADYNKIRCMFVFIHVQV